MRKFHNRAASGQSAGAVRRMRTRRHMTAGHFERMAPVFLFTMNRRKAAQAARLMPEFQRLMRDRRKASPPREVPPAVRFSLVPPPPERDPGRRLIAPEAGSSTESRETPHKAPGGVAPGDAGNNNDFGGANKPGRADDAGGAGAPDAGGEPDVADDPAAGAADRAVAAGGAARSGVSTARMRRETDLAFATVGRLRHLLETGETTSVELTELALDRLRRYGPGLNCVVRDCASRAREQAKRMDAERKAGSVRGPLHGIPWGAKDLLDTAGIATEYGAEPFQGRVPERDAAVVRSLDAAGAVLVAKLSLGALAYGDVWYAGRTNNPWDVHTGSSGSSAGSAAAVVAGLVPFALGTETMGSIISPSLACGAAGLRPTFGRVSRDGCMPLAWSYDKIGPVARTASCTAEVLSVIAASDSQGAAGDPDWRSAPFEPFAMTDLSGVRIGMCEQWFTAVSDEDGARERGTQSVREALERCGAECVNINLPEFPYEALSLPVYTEAASSFETLTESGEDDMLRSQTLESWPNIFRTSRFIAGTEYVEVQRLRTAIAKSIDTLLESVDMVLAPSGGVEMLLATNGSGHPSLTIRTGFDGEGLPAGATLYGRYWEESALVAVGSVLEGELAAAKARPPDYI